MAIRLAKSGDNGLAQSEAISTANKRGARILSNRELDKRLIGSESWRSELGLYPVWAGTHIAYGEEGKKLGDAIKHTDMDTGKIYVFEVPEKYRNEKNAIIAVEHGFYTSQDGTEKPIFTLEQDGKYSIVQIADKGKITLLPNFPSGNGWYIADPVFGIPLGSKAPPRTPEARYLWRASRSHVGLLARGDYFLYGYDSRRNVYACESPSFHFGVLLDGMNIVI